MGVLDTLRNKISGSRINELNEKLTAVIEKNRQLTSLCEGLQADLIKSTGKDRQQMREALRFAVEDRELLASALVEFVKATEAGATVFHRRKNECLELAYKGLRQVGKASGVQLGRFVTERGAIIDSVMEQERLK